MPKKLDRYGRNSGTNFALVPAEGRYSFWERAIPYLRNEKSYHEFKVNGKNYCDKIDAIRSRNFNKLNKIPVEEE